MASTSELLYPDPTPLKGGCHCKSIRYNIAPEPYKPAAQEAGPTKEDPTNLKLPYIDICHCQTCRSVTTAVFNTWVGIPISWLSFTLRNVSGNPDQDVMMVNGQDLLDQYLIANPSHPKEPVTPIKYPESTLTYYSTSPGVLRSFCSKCGTGIFFAATGDAEGSVKEGSWKIRDMIRMLWGTLDKEHFEEERVKPNVHCWFGESVGWVKKGMEEGGWGELNLKWDG